MVERLFFMPVKPGYDGSFPEIHMLREDDLPLFDEHLLLCGQTEMSVALWQDLLKNDIRYYGYFVEERMVGRACIEKYSEDRWEVADVRVVKPYRNQGIATKLCRAMMANIFAHGKAATIRTEEDNDAMLHVIN